MSVTPWKPAIAIGLTAATAGAFFASGASSALWKETLNIPQATISAGNLQAAALGGLTWSNPSTTGDPTIMLPGETVTGVQAADVGLEGANMEANVVVRLVNGTTEPIAPASGYTVTYRITSASGAELVPPTPINATALLTLKPHNVSSVSLDGVADLNIEISVTVSTEVDPEAPPFVGTYLAQLNQTQA